MKTTLFAASAIALCLTAAAAQAQDTSANATYETVTLSGGFTPDPYVVDVYSGGGVDAGNIGCAGFIANAPDVRLNFSAGSLPLIISATSAEDTTLVVNAPDGQWYCNDDSDGTFDPALSFDNPMSGRYEVWVGTFGTTSTHPAQLSISELYSAAGSSGGMPQSAGGPDINADAIFETVTLSGGFTPDPYAVNLAAGGANDASRVSSQCVGYIATAPDVRLNFTPGSLPLILSANSSSDTTLVVNAPDGQWYCDDDGGDGVNPLINFDRPMAGRYEIWVGTYSSGGTSSAQLNISELSGGRTMGNSPPQQPRPSPSQSSGINVNADAIYENIRLTSGFTPDPYVVRMSSGGVNDASSVSSACTGFIASSPDVRLTFDAGSLPLIISATSMADTTLVINAPDGQWYCNDDGGQNMNPSVRFQTPLSGRYEIWVGTYGAAESHATELNISELYSQ